MAEQKTNVMRLLEQAGMSYTAYAYDTDDGCIDGISVAKKIGQPAEQVYKTLVARTDKGGICVFVIPVAAELDLKLAAKVSGAKSVAMVKAAEINSLTGYIRGGCSPVGMKKKYPTFLDISCLSYDIMIVSAGKIGRQAALSPADLIRVIGAQTAALTDAINHQV